MKFSCPECRAPLRLASAPQSMKIVCPKCGHEILLGPQRLKQRRLPSSDASPQGRPTGRPEVREKPSRALSIPKPIPTEKVSNAAREQRSDFPSAEPERALEHLLKQHASRRTALVLLALLAPFFLPEFGLSPGREAGLMFCAGAFIPFQLIRDCFPAIYAHRQRRQISGHRRAIQDASVTAFLRTLLLSLPLLFVFQFVATTCSTFFPRLEFRFWWARPLSFLLWGCVTGIGFCYTSLFAPDDGASLSFGSYWILTFISVAFCEEILKLLLACPHDAQTDSEAAFLGAAAGVGFGVAEAIWYHFTFSLPMGADLNWYFIRFISVVGLHGLWTALSVMILFRLRFFGFDLLSALGVSKNATGWEFQFAEVLRFFHLLIPCLGSMALHATYNTGVTHLPILALATIVVSAVVPVWLLKSSPVPYAPSATSTSQTSG